MRASTFKPAFETFGSAHSSRLAVFTHGILGQKRNWRTPAREFLKIHSSDFLCVNTDHRGHGESKVSKDMGPHTVHACAIDLASLLTNVDGPVKSKPTSMMLSGHSFGGKVALKAIQNSLEGGIMILPKHTWILDSIPKKYSKEYDLSQKTESVVYIMDMLTQLPPTFPSREWVIDEIQKFGCGKAVAQWLATNVIPVPASANQGPGDNDNHMWTFDISVVIELFDDFCELDMLPFLRNYDGEGHIHFVRAGRNVAWEKTGALEDFNALCARNKRIHLHAMPAVGHWLHVEDLRGMLTLMWRESGGLV